MTRPPSAGGEIVCSRCGQTSPSLYEMRSPAGDITLRCFRHALLYRPMVRRSLVIALIVGTILIAINQGNVILGGDFPPSLYWKIPLTYCVSFAVATTGALLNARSGNSQPGIS